MSQDENVADVVPAPAEEPAKVAPEPEEKPVDTEDAFIEESLGDVSAPAVAEEPEKEPEPEPKAEPVALEPPKEEEPKETPAESPKESQPVDTPKEPSRLDRRITQKYVENLVLKGIEAPSAEEIAQELSVLSVEEKKNALKNLLDENRTIRGQKPEPLSHEDEEAIIEAEVERRYQEEKKAIFEHDFQQDLIATLAAHPELDNRTDKYNPKIEKAVAQIVQSGMFASAAYAIVKEAIENAKDEAKKAHEISVQQSMSGAVIAPPVTEEIKKTPETDEDKFLADAGVI